jgi:ribosomal protein S6--L-glutamate ligase
LKFSIGLASGEPLIYYCGKPLPEPDAVIPRIGTSITFFGTSVVRQFQQMGVYCANSAHGIQNTRDKLRALQTLSKYDLGIAESFFVRNEKDILTAIEKVGGAPVIIKLLEGTQGRGVILAETQKVAEAIIEAMHGANLNVMVQKFVAESKGRDVRAFVVGDRVVAAMRRVAAGQGFRSNIHRGGTAEPIDLDPDYEQTAVRSAQILGLQVAGVDMLEGADGPQVIEVNSSPGLEGIETCTGLDVAGEIIDHVAQMVRFPELDIRERLTVSKGFGVAEISVAEGSPLVGKTIRECGLRDEDISVLTLERQGKTIANPLSTRELEADDKLLCFGRLERLRDWIPDRRAKKRRRNK